MSEPCYIEHAPRQSLREFAQCVWTFSAAEDGAPQPIAPDGRCELILHLREPYRELREEGAVVQPPVLFAGQITRPLTLQAQGGVSVIGVRFRPDGARAFLGSDLDVTTDKRIDLAAAQGDDAAALLRAARDDELRIERRIELIEDYVEARIAASKRTPAIDPIVRAAVTRLLAGEDLDPDHGVSARTLQRRFKAEVGVSPRELQSVLRFRRVFDSIEGEEPPGWIEAALAAGYFDQPHMARDFRRYLGVSSRQWAMQRAGLAKLLTARVSESYK